jgi:hypothetical protein
MNCTALVLLPSRRRAVQAAAAQVTLLGDGGDGSTAAIGRRVLSSTPTE